MCENLTFSDKVWQNMTGTFKEICSEMDFGEAAAIDNVKAFNLTNKNLHWQ